MIVLGADVGKTTGLAVLDCSGARPRYLATAMGRETLVEVTQTIFRAHDIVLVGIETPSQVFEHGRAQESEGARRSIERALLVARDAAGQVRAVAGMSGAEVHDGQAHHVRRAVLGKLPKTGVDRFIASRLPLLVDGWPARSNDHERDAAIVALWAWQRAKVGLKPGESAPRSKAKRRERDAATLQDVDRARAAIFGYGPTVGDLRAAAERLGVKPRGHDCIRVGCSPEWTAIHAQFCGEGQTPRKPVADPGEERAACMLAGGSRCCGAALGEPCKEDGRPFAFGVHRERARGAGIVGVDARGLKLCGYLRKADGSCCKHGPSCGALRPTGPRKLATVRPVECYARLPWNKPCGACKGTGVSGHLDFCVPCGGLGLLAVRWTAVEATAPAEVAFPLEERRHAVTRGETCEACRGLGVNVTRSNVGPTTERPCVDCQGHGRVLRMIRRPWRRAGVECWLYKPAT